MNEKKFSKKLNDMTPEEKQRKDALWEKISLESGIEVGVKKPFPLRLAMTVAMCVLVLCVAIPLVVFNLNKPTHQAGGSVTTSQGDTSFTSILPDNDPNMFSENEYIYVASPETIEVIAQKDNNILFVKDWERDENATSFMKEKGTDRVIGILDESTDNTNNCQISVNILFEDISILSIDKEIENMKNTKLVEGINVSWSSANDGGSASFVYHNYTYFVKVKGQFGKDALNAAQSLITSKKINNMLIRKNIRRSEKIVRYVFFFAFV